MIGFTQREVAEYYRIRRQCLPSQDHDGNHRSGRNDGMLPRNIVCCEPG
jgi:hypothetical protein